MALIEGRVRRGYGLHSNDLHSQSPYRYGLYSYAYIEGRVRRGRESVCRQGGWGEWPAHPRTHALTHPHLMMLYALKDTHKLYALKDTHKLCALKDTHKLCALKDTHKLYALKDTQTVRP